MLVSKLLRLLGLLQLLDAPEDSLTMGVFFLGCGGRCALLSGEADSPSGQQPWERAGVRHLLLGPRHVDLSYSEKEPSLLEAPSAF